MHSVRPIFAPIFVCLAVLAATAFGQTPEPTPTPAPSDDLGTSKVFEVRLPVTVTMGKKELVSGMTRGDLRFSRMACGRRSRISPTRRRIRLFTSEC